MRDNLDKKNIRVSYFLMSNTQLKSQDSSFHDLKNFTISEKKVFENNGHIHAYCPLAGADNPLGSFKKNYKSSDMFYPINYFVTDFPFQTHRQPN